MNRQPMLPGFDFESNGTDNEEDIDFLSGSDASNLLLWPSDWTVETIIRQIERGNIQLDPNFQRRDVWSTERKSRFIESLIINLPVPQIVLAEDPGDRSKFIVVDGKQRLLSILQFFGRNSWERYTLSGLKILKLDGKDIDSIPPSVKSDLENRSIRCIIIKGAPSNNLLNIIFHRLNSNTIALSSQELRQSLFSGPFSAFANQFTRDEPFLSELFGGSGPDFRMRDIELLIRFLAFKNNVASYPGNLKSFLDAATDFYNKNWIRVQPLIQQQSLMLKNAISSTYLLLEEDAFRKYVPDLDRFEYRFNRSIFDVFAYFLSENTTEVALLGNRKAFLKQYKALFGNAEFTKSIESTTKSKQAVRTRFIMFGELLAKFDNSVVVPTFV